jgi:hypothetical protein
MVYFLKSWARLNLGSIVGFAISGYATYYFLQYGMILSVGSFSKSARDSYLTGLAGAFCLLQYCAFGFFCHVVGIRNRDVPRGWPSPTTYYSAIFFMLEILLFVSEKIALSYELGQEIILGK